MFVRILVYRRLGLSYFSLFLGWNINRGGGLLGNIWWAFRGFWVYRIVIVVFWIIKVI